MSRYCATTFVQQGIPDANHSYDGANLLRCARCQITFYKCKEAQKASWKLHKRNCQPMTPSNESYIQSLSLNDAMSELKIILTSGGKSSRISHGIVPLLKHIRQRFDDNKNKKISSDVELTLHGMGRGFIFGTSRNIQSLWSMPGMANYLLSNEEENLLSPLSLFEIEHYRGIGCKRPGRPGDIWERHIAKHDEKSPGYWNEIGDRHFELDQKNMCQTPSVYKFAFGYFNFIVAAAVASNPSPSSIHDGTHGSSLRLNPDRDNIPLTMAALRRSLSSWKDNYVRGSLGDATAPAASLALTALKELTDRGRYEDTHPPRCDVLRYLRETEVVPGLDVADVVVTALGDISEMAASRDYSYRCLKYLAAHRDAPFVSTKWKSLSDERNAEIVLAVVAHIENEGECYKASEEGPRFRNVTPIPKALMAILDGACRCGKYTVEDRRRVLTVAANDERLGFDNPGSNFGTRAILHYYLEKYNDVNGADIVKAVEWCNSCPSRFQEKRLKDGTPEMSKYKEMQIYRKMALGNVEEIDYDLPF